MQENSKAVDSKPKKVGFVSLGCPKALVDSERILGELTEDGYETVPDFESADLVVVNTCGFIDAAIEESLDTIEQALSDNGRVIVTGCLGARKSLIEERFPDVLHVSGPQAVAEVTAAVRQFEPARSGPLTNHTEPLMDAVGMDAAGELTGARTLLTPKHFAYLKISEGCNHKCSFCIIPSMRGKLVSRDIADNLAEAEQLAANGVKELLVISQDTSAYGLDLRYAENRWQGRTLASDLSTLCKELGQMFEWVRLHYVYPYPHVDGLIELMNDGLILPYLDVPLQHAAPGILKAMRRPAAAEKTLDRVLAWRRQCPELKLRSTFIVGFPGETEADFERLLEFLQIAQLDRVGAFTYSNVDGAAASTLSDHVPEGVKEERLARFMAVQADISAARLRDWVGLETRVMIDSVGPHGSNLAVGRTYGDAPEIDGVVNISNGAGLVPGQFAWVHIEDSDQHDLRGSFLGDAVNLD